MSIDSHSISMGSLALLLCLPLAARSADTAAYTGVAAIPTADFLDSIGICSTFPDRGQPIGKTIDMVKYCGFRWVRGGIEGLSESPDGKTTIATYLKLHQATGVKFSWGLVSSGTDIDKLIRTAKQIESAGALLAFEGNNEPNNWGVTYQGEEGGGRAPSWMAVAKLQRDMYAAVKAEPQLAKYPVWSITENGAEADNVGLQFLTIPEKADTAMPAGTKYADYANCHNYIYHGNNPKPKDNKCWLASAPGPECDVDGLYGNYGRTWHKKFPGYSIEQLQTLPRVATETGCTTNDEITEDIQGLNLMTFYLTQYKRGWSHTSPYILRDRTDEAGNQTFGFFKADYTPRKAAVLVHNLTTILADPDQRKNPGKLDYSIASQPVTTHDMLLQHSNGTMQLVVWSERIEGEDNIVVNLGRKYASVVIYDPTTGTAPVKSLKNADAVDLAMSDHPYILFIK